jgi:hypothetical protein
VSVGWGINIWRQVDSPDTRARTRRGFIGRLEASLGGLDWLDALVAAGHATSLGGDGYPVRYTVAAAVLMSTLYSGPHRHDGSLVIGADCTLPGVWAGDISLDRSVLAECSPDEELMIEAWDQS